MISTDVKPDDRRHIDILRRGVDVWNAWREKNPHEKIDLSGTDLSGNNLRGAILDHADLRGTDLRDTNLESVYLRGAILNHASLRGAILKGTILEHANLSGIDFRDTNLEGVYLRGAILNHADLSATCLNSVHLEGTDLRGAILNRAYLCSAHLYRADLRDADLRGADLRDADLRGANLIGTNLIGANLIGADLSSTNLNKVIGIDKQLLTDTVIINIHDKEINPEDLSQLENTSRKLMSVLGYAFVEKYDVEHGSWFGKLRFKLVRFVTPEVREKFCKEAENLIKQGKESTHTRLENPGVESTKQMAEATSELLKALENFDNAAIRLGKLLVVKVTDEDGRSQIVAETISLRLQNKMEENPQFLRDPKAVAAFFEQEEKIEIAS